MNRVYVHAWEYCNPGPKAGGGGFDWYHDESGARAAFEDAGGDARWAHFFFAVLIPGGVTDITRYIEEDVDGFYRESEHKLSRIGEEVKAYLALEPSRVRGQ